MDAVLSTDVEIKRKIKQNSYFKMKAYPNIIDGLAQNKRIVIWSKLYAYPNTIPILIQILHISKLIKILFQS